MMGRKVLGILALVLTLALVVLALLSWLLSATTSGGVRSLLSAEGIRFFFGGFVSMLQQPLLVWLLLLSMAWGSLSRCGLLDGKLQRPAVMMVAGLLAIYMALIMLLTLTPHAVLLSATGGLWPSAFSRALVPVVAFAVVMAAVTYGLLARRFLSLADIVGSLSDGIAAAAPLLLLYVLLMQLLESLRFVVG